MDKFEKGQPSTDFFGAAKANDPARTELNAAFLKAAEEGDLERVKDALDQGASVHAQDKDGDTALHWCGDPEIVRFLLSRQINVNALNDAGFTALHNAYDTQQVLNILLEADADPNIQDNSGLTALMEAAHAGMGEAVKSLLAFGAKPDLRNLDGNTALIDAVVIGSLPVVRILTEAGADLAIENSEGFTAADLAGMCEHKDIEKYLKETALEKELSVYNTGLPYPVKATKPFKFKRGA